ncbi:hypothetical protein [Desulfovibrio gilichinskyi]|uniref:Phage protein n=1 Tax=Desulfovibrio gilichinskyi TaxID=1519643 RepID=A0A1X7C3G2_9BACT|nr:hypothetical protein [Desulfovibrio gilichinskyi]SME89372.1 hypothetical protein SAMN06295933_0285 [Desulfovibrio gilichinskyi]
MKFRKKPVVIEAFQMTKERRQDNSEWPEWLNKAWNKELGEIGFVGGQDFSNSDGTDELFITTLKGHMRCSFGDYIIKGVQGELYPCKLDIFEQTYEAVE